MFFTLVPLEWITSTTTSGVQFLEVSFLMAMWITSLTCSPVTELFSMYDVSCNLARSQASCVDTLFGTSTWSVVVLFLFPTNKTVLIANITNCNNCSLHALELTNKETKSCIYYTVIKHEGHLRTRGNCRKYEAQASVFYTSRVSSNFRSVLSQCNTRLRVLHVLYDVYRLNTWKTIKHAFSMFYLTNKEAWAVYYTVIKHDGHLKTRGKCRKHEPQASVFYISRVFSNDRSVLSQCNTRLRLLHLL